jgi:hypothetical protein
VAGRPDLLRLHVLAVSAVFGRAGAASCCWSASHPSNCRLAHAGLFGRG